VMVEGAQMAVCQIQVANSRRPTPGGLFHPV